MRLLLLAGCLLVSTGVPAGHGFLNSFGDIVALPAPGRTPDQLGYGLDRLAERARLALTANTERLGVLLEFAREKLAELDAMVRAEDAAAATTAASAYVEYLEEAALTLTELSAELHDAQARRFADALLEHQYLIAVEYLDLPRASRPTIGVAVGAARAQYERLAAMLPRAYRDQQFFKEEEVRWTWELAEQADAQGL